MKAVQILSGFDGDKGGTSRRLVHKARPGEGRQVQGVFRSPDCRENQKGNCGWSRKSLGWQAGGDLGPTGESVGARFEKRQLKMTKQLLTRDLEFKVWGRQDLELSPKASSSGLWAPRPAFSFF